ncbi:MAG: ABC transporter substrate-binding protein [Candidatus Bipolaricaulota bacterium]|nr:ABC transporter substrate-binding protein [Candidatus Bipolaricaulota bacterium]
MKRGIAVLVIGLLIAAVAVAGLGAPIRIGICKIVEHPALDANERGIIDALTAAGYVEGKDVEYFLASAQGDPNNAIPIAQDFQAKGVTLVVAISTPMALAAAKVFEGTGVPVVFSAVTDPVAAGLVLDDDDPSQNGNVTGVSDLIDVAGDLGLLKELSSSIRRIGIVYNPGEANSARLTAIAEAAAPGLGLSMVKAVADTSANVPAAAQSLVGRVDAFYVTTDNTVVSAIDAVIAAAEEGNVPFLMADPTSLRFGPVLATGFDYYKQGLLAGDIVLQILGGRKPNQIPVVYQTGAEIHLNLDAAAHIGLTFPASLIDRATGIFFGGASWLRSDG